MAGDDRVEELRLLREIARWARVAALPGLRTRAHDLLDTDSKKRAYSAMDGATGLVAIEKATGANHNDVAKWLKGWVPEGLVDPDTSPPRASFKLSDLGLETPPPKAPRPKRTAA